MSKKIYRFFQCMIALGLATYLAEKWVSGRLSFYINMRFSILTLLSIVMLAALAMIGLAPIFSRQHTPGPVDGGPGPKNRNSTWSVLFLTPLFIAFIGLSIVEILFAFFIVALVGLVRLLSSEKLEMPDAHQPPEIPTTALIILAIPLVVGFFVPVRPLSTASINTRGMSLSAPASLDRQSVRTLEVIPDDQTVLDWIKIFNYEEDLSPYLGKSANVIGFVYHDPRLKAGQFMLSRFTITCCVADAFAIGIAVDWLDSASLADNAWVNVQGPVDMITIDGQRVPVIRAGSVNPVQVPEQPYLYP